MRQQRVARVFPPRYEQEPLFALVQRLALNAQAARRTTVRDLFRFQNPAAPIVFVASTRRCYDSNECVQASSVDASGAPRRRRAADQANHRSTTNFSRRRFRFALASRPNRSSGRCSPWHTTGAASAAPLVRVPARRSTATSRRRRDRVGDQVRRAEGNQHALPDDRVRSSRPSRRSTPRRRPPPRRSTCRSSDTRRVGQQVSRRRSRRHGEARQAERSQESASRPSPDLGACRRRPGPSSRADRPSIEHEVMEIVTYADHLLSVGQSWIPSTSMPAMITCGSVESSSIPRALRMPDSRPSAATTNRHVAVCSTPSRE